MNIELGTVDYLPDQNGKHSVFNWNENYDCIMKTTFEDASAGYVDLQWNTTGLDMN